MNEFFQQMFPKDGSQSPEERMHRLREVMQQLALLALWRAKFFDTAAFYGGTALRILYGLDRFSEDLDFSLLAADAGFSFEPYTDAIERELASYGLTVAVQPIVKTHQSSVESAFLKANTLQQLMIIESPADLLVGIHPQAQLKIKLEADTNPPGQFETELQYILTPVPFAVRSFTLPCMFAGKMHALLCRGWKNRVKGRDWYDFVWYASRHPQLHLVHLEARMRQTGHYVNTEKLSAAHLSAMFSEKLSTLDIDKAREEVRPFLRDPGSVELWSIPFFEAVFDRIQFV